MRWMLDVVVAFLLLGLGEALVKPIAKRFVQRRILRVAPLVYSFGEACGYEQLDPFLPALLQRCSGAELEQVVRTSLEALTGESWAGEDLSLLFRLFDPRAAADRASQGVTPMPSPLEILPNLADPEGADS